MRCWLALAAQRSNRHLVLAGGRAIEDAHATQREGTGDLEHPLETRCQERLQLPVDEVQNVESLTTVLQVQELAGAAECVHELTGIVEQETGWHDFTQQGVVHAQKLR